MKRRAILKCMAVLLAALLLSQTASVALEAPSGTSYTGRVLAAINTDYTSSDKGKSFAADFPPYEEEDEEPSEGARPQAAKQPWDLLWDQVEPMTPEEAAMAQAAEGDVVQAQRAKRPSRVGDKRSITAFPELPDDYETMNLKESIRWIIGFVRNRKQELTCVYTNDVCTVWIEDENAWTQEQITALGNYVGNAIPQLEDLFGDVRIDTDHDGKFAIYIHSMNQSDTIRENQGDTVVGYFTMLDLVDKYMRIGDVRMKSNITEILLIGSRSDNIHINMECTDLDSMKDVFVHEYQHYIHSCYSYAGKNNKTYLKEDKTYVNEGFSVASEMILFPSEERRQSLSNLFNLSQREYSIVTWEDHMANYGLVYPFFQYIRTRYADLTGDKEGDFPGKGIYRRVMESRDRSNQDNTLGIIADILYPADRYASLADTDARCRQLITDFWLAVYYKEPQGEHGFNGEAWADELTVSTEYFGDETTLRSAMAAFCILNDGDRGTITIRNADEGVRFVEINEPMRSVTFDPNGGYGTAYTVVSTHAKYRVPRQTDVNILREGYAFTGWALTADAEEPDYVSGEEIELKGQLTLYAVWKSAERIEPETEYPFELAAGVCITVQLVLPEDGVYYLESGDVLYADLYDMEYEEYYCLLGEEEGTLLRGGVIYTMLLALRSPESENVCEVGSYAIRRRTEYHTLLYYLEWSPDLDADDWIICRQYGSAYTVSEYGYEPYGKDFCGWTTEPGGSEPMYHPGDEIVLTGDMVLYGIWKPWDTLQADVPFAIETQSASLRFVPEKTAVYRVSATSVDEESSYTLQNLDQTLDDRYEWCLDSRTYTLNAGEEYYIFTNQIASVCVELVSEKLQHSLYLFVYDLLNQKRIKTLSVELTGSNTYVLPDYRPVSLGYYTFDFWRNAHEDEKYYPGDTVTLDRDTILVALGSTPYSIESEDSSVAKIFMDLGVMLLKFIPLWMRSFVQRIRYFGLSNMNFEVPWSKL